MFDFNGILLFDGAMGTMLNCEGQPDLLCLSDPDTVTAVHRAYVEAGSDVITTNTFGSNAMKLGDAERVEEVYAAAVSCAHEAGPRYVAADIGPVGELLDPYGDLEEGEAYELFAGQARAAAGAGADLVIIETMADVNEAVLAVRAVKESCSLPVFATMTFSASGRTFMGATPEDAVSALEGIGVDALGVNCSVGPVDLQPIVFEMLELASCPIIVQANAGLPEIVDDQAIYSLSPEDYAAAVAPMVEAGARVVGGCCGTTPDYIRALAALC